MVSNAGRRSRVTIGALIGIAGLTCGILNGPVAHGGTPAHTYTKAQQISYHLARGKKLWLNDDVDNAVAEWKEVLRLDPTNEEAKRLIDESGTGSKPDSTAQNSLSASPLQISTPTTLNGESLQAIKDALTQYAKVEDLASLTEILDDVAADTFAYRLMFTYRNAIQAHFVESDPRDPDLLMDYEHFIDSHGLGLLFDEQENGITPFYSTNRLHGRAFLRAMNAWIARCQNSRLWLTWRRPAGWKSSAEKLDQDTFITTASGTVLVNAPASDGGIPLEARLEGGRWRIGTRAGQGFDFEFFVDYPHPILHE